MPSTDIIKKTKSDLIGLRRLAADSVKFFGKHAKKLILIAAVVAFPSALLRLAVDAQEDVSSYLFLASMFTNLALIWAIREFHAGRPVKAKQAYYKGAASVVPFILVVFVLTFQSLPFLLGMVLFVLGTGGSEVPLSLGENLLLGLVWAILSIPTIYWLNRYLFSIFAAAEGSTPIQALRISKSKVKGSSWRVLMRLAALVVAVTLVLMIPVFLAQQIESLALLFAMQLVTSMVILPLVLIYLYKLHQDLK